MHARPKIEKLSAIIANQIAAGEVVERPAAVVKELVENSLDAGATRIEVEFQQGGKTYIRVEDNGYGMTLEDARLSLERHATSKLRTAQDLLSLNTFGFRGEALPSIASVAEFSLSTKIEEALQGWEISIDAGKLLHERPCGKAVGTRIEVRHLFHPVPARRKFLKTDATEAAHIVQLVRLYALTYPTVGFILKENARILFKSAPCKTLRERFEAIYGASASVDFIDLPLVEASGLKLWGLIGRPGLSRASREELATLVNNRPITSRLLNQGIIDAYRTFIPPGRYPAVFIFIDIDPAAIDVNVHPTKQEVRFRDEVKVRSAVLSAIQARLEEALGGLKPMEVTGDNKHTSTAFPFLPSLHAPTLGATTPEAPFSIHQPLSKTVFKEPDLPPYYTPTIAPAHTSKLTPKYTPALTLTGPVKTVASKDILPGWRLLCHWEQPYSVLMSPSGLILLNRRRARARVAYENALKKESLSDAKSQSLLMPIALDLAPAARARLNEARPFFEAQGFVFEEKNHQALTLTGIPSLFSPEKAATFINDTLGALHETKRSTSDTQAHFIETLAGAYADSIVKATTAEAEEAILALIHQLFQTNKPLVCPKGHPTYFELSLSEVQRRLPK